VRSERIYGNAEAARRVYNVSGTKTDKHRLVFRSVQTPQMVQDKLLAASDITEGNHI
jgi:hypothetical protein